MLVSRHRWWAAIRRAIRTGRRFSALAVFSMATVVSADSAHAQASAPAEGAFPEGRAGEFARVLQDDEEQPVALQIGINRYQGLVNGRLKVVDLVGAVHVGDRGYYAELNQRFKAYDAVLFELIAPEGAAAGMQERNEQGGGFISQAQLLMTKALGLKFQLDEIDYGAENFVHADLSPSQFSQSMADRNESMYVYFWRMFYASINEATKDPLGLREINELSRTIRGRQGNPLKVAFAYEMTNIETVTGALAAGETGSAIIEARNERAIEVLRDELAAGSENVAIFYGVAHMPDFEARLMDELGFDYERTLWINAWHLAGQNDDGAETAERVYR